LTEAEAICERVLVLDSGKLSADITLPLENGSLEETFMSIIKGGMA
jgi:ABC-type multidrug transport system ATPase subunit